MISSLSFVWSNFAECACCFAVAPYFTLTVTHNHSWELHGTNDLSPVSSSQRSSYVLMAEDERRERISVILLPRFSNLIGTWPIVQAEQRTLMSSFL